MLKNKFAQNDPKMVLLNHWNEINIIIDYNTIVLLTHTY